MPSHAPAAKNAQAGDALRNGLITGTRPEPRGGGGVHHEINAREDKEEGLSEKRDLRKVRREMEESQAEAEVLAPMPLHTEGRFQGIRLGYHGIADLEFF